MNGGSRGNGTENLLSAANSKTLIRQLFTDDRNSAAAATPRTTVLGMVCDRSRTIALEKVIACVFLESGLASSSEGTLPTHGKQAPVAVRPELSRQESSETETSGTDYTDATRTDDHIGGARHMGRIGV
ncbi:hypothetical protein E3N88_26585 [Mikania micrantha]|uniref:Uncharacterized protein n=1 Tax=Mikania micrantha TaxID=192012 RepID=A0A5N6MVR0_9ASTR|nr:hypothetical protein E3N88_26585 [Mikania micrantha]